MPSRGGDEDFALVLPAIQFIIINKVNKRHKKVAGVIFFLFGMHIRGYKVRHKKKGENAHASSYTHAHISYRLQAALAMVLIHLWRA